MIIKTIKNQISRLRCKIPAIHKNKLKINKDFSDEDIDSIMFEAIDKIVTMGFETREEIIDSVYNVFRRNFNISDKYEIINITDFLLNEQSKEQVQWSTKTDCDKLDEVFDQLENHGIIARQNYSCCMSCAGHEIHKEIKKLSKSKKIDGYVYYNIQDLEDVINTGTLLLAFGDKDETVRESQSIGITICDALVKQGFNVEWDGSVNKKISIVNFDWKKRR